MPSFRAVWRASWVSKACQALGSTSRSTSRAACLSWSRLRCSLAPTLRKGVHAAIPCVAGPAALRFEPVYLASDMPSKSTRMCWRGQNAWDLAGRCFKAAHVPFLLHCHESFAGVSRSNFARAPISSLHGPQSCACRAMACTKRACAICRLQDLLASQVFASETFMTFLLLWTVFFNIAHIF